jgi:hypothetical protein
LHREGGAHSAHTTRANTGGVIGETPDDRRGGAEEESFQLGLINLSASPRRHAHGWWTYSSRQSRSSLDD